MFSDRRPRRARRKAGRAAIAPTLSASEIGSYTFCPRAWYLQRHGVPTDREAALRRAVGSEAHRRIGRRTALVVAAGMVRRALLVLMTGLALALAARWLGVLP